MYFSTFFRILLSLLIAVMSLLPARMGLPVGPSVIFDAADLTGDVTDGASGYLYGIAEDGVPSYNMVESLDVSSVSAKTQTGLQHPIGEVGDIAPELTANGKCDYIVVYLQDMYDTWYYDHADITEMKKNGTYDWREYLENTYFPMIAQTVTAMQNEDYADKLVYCLFNECDNGVWFGEWTYTDDPANGWHNFNEQGRQNFLEAWKLTYDYVRSLRPDAVIGGPGNYEYNYEKMDSFLQFTSANDCVPDVMIYHELGDRSIYDWEANVRELRETEEKYGISADTPIIVTEYGRMQDNGDPNTMLKYIACIENSKVYADQAYWLLANNLCNTAADYNTPNSAWWVYRWYTNMTGQTMNVEIEDILHSDLGKALKEKREPRYQQLLGVGSLTDEKDKIDLLVSGTDYSSVAKVKNLRNTALFGETVRVTVTAVTYQGLSGKVYAPEIVKSYTQKCGGSLTVTLDAAPDTAYHIEVTKAGSDGTFVNQNLYTRYEWEDGELLGNAYTYDSAYATTGAQQGMIGGMEHSGDGVFLTIQVPEDGDYELRLIYGNSNDGRTAADRTDSESVFLLDGEARTLSFPNTVKSELTDAYDLRLSLTKGTHTLCVMQKTGTIVLDSLLIRKAETVTQIYAEKDDDRPSSFLVIAPEDGYYKLETDANAEISVDGAPVKTDGQGSALIYLRRGLNYLDVPENASCQVFVSGETGFSVSLLPADAILADGASVRLNDKTQTVCLDGISSDGGSASYTVTVPESGVYKLTIRYAANRENGVHDYNVDLVEDFVTISVGGVKQQNLYCRSTYSDDTYTTVTTNVTLSQGENLVTFSNDGANRFRDGVTYAPAIAGITIAAAHGVAVATQ